MVSSRRDGRQRVQLPPGIYCLSPARKELASSSGSPSSRLGLSPEPASHLHELDCVLVNVVLLGAPPVPAGTGPGVGRKLVVPRSSLERGARHTSLPLCPVRASKRSRLHWASRLPPLHAHAGKIGYATR